MRSCCSSLCFASRIPRGMMMGAGVATSWHNGPLAALGVWLQHANACTSPWDLMAQRRALVHVFVSCLVTDTIGIEPVLSNPAEHAALPVQLTPLSGQSQWRTVRPARRAKAHVASACVNCKRAHLSCDVQRPCSRCVAGGKEVCLLKDLFLFFAKFCHFTVGVMGWA